MPYNNYKCVLSSLLFIFIISTNGFATLELKSDDNVSWTPIPPINKSYADWEFFERNIDSYDRINTNIFNLSKDSSGFMWGINKFDDKFIDIEFLVDGNVHDKCNGTSLRPVNPFIFNKDSKYGLSFWVRTNTNIEIILAFPPDSKKPDNENETPQIIPRIIAFPNQGYNNTQYNVSFALDNLKYEDANAIIRWGDGSASNVKVYGSEILSLSHSWADEGVYSIEVEVQDKNRNRFSFIMGRMKILRLVKVAPGVELQPIINRIQSNTTVLLEGNDYKGPINITDSNISNIIIYSNNETRITPSMPNFEYILGLENVNNISLNNLTISDAVNGIYLKNCNYCSILGNHIYFKKRGIHITSGTNNIVKDNNLEKIDNFDGNSKGISIEDSKENIIIDNTFTKLNNDDNFIFFARNATFLDFCFDYYTDGMINIDECCARFLNGKLGSCNVCIYEGEKDQNNSCELRLDDWRVSS